MLIDSTYFIGEINIAQLGQRTVQQKLDVFISKREPEYLKAVLGYALYKAYADGLEIDPIAARWTDLQTGADYTDSNGNLQRWEGFVNEAMISPIANYIYYWFTRDNASKTTATSEKQEDTQGATTVSMAPKQARAWNEMVALNYRLHDFLLNKKVDNVLVYPEFTTSVCCCICKEDIMHTINIFNL